MKSARIMRLAERAALLSEDTTTQVGAVIVSWTFEVLSLGVNGFPIGVVDQPSRRERPDKYLYTEHAERNAIYSACRLGIVLVGSRMFTTHYPCADCARAIIQSGITSVVHLPIEPDFASRYVEHINAARVMFAEAGVEVALYEPHPTQNKEVDND